MSKKVSVRLPEEEVWEDFLEFAEQKEGKKWGSSGKNVIKALKLLMAEEGYKDYKHDPDLKDYQDKLPHKEKKLTTKKPTTKEISEDLIYFSKAQGKHRIDKQSLEALLVRDYEIEKEHTLQTTIKNLQRIKTIAPSPYGEDEFIIVPVKMQIEQQNQENLGF